MSRRHNGAIRYRARQPTAELESGQLSVLIIGFVIVIGLLVVVIANASGAYLAHRRLAAAADGAAVSAAAGIDKQIAYRDGIEATTKLPLSQSQARALARRYVSDSGLTAHGITIDGVSVYVAGRQVTVRLEATVPASMSPPGWPDSAHVSAQASAESRVGR